MEALMLDRKTRRKIESNSRKILKKIKSGDWVELQQSGNLGQPVFACMHESRFDEVGSAMATVYNTMYGEQCAELGMIHTSTHYVVRRMTNDDILSLPAGVLSVAAKNQKLCVATGEAF
jgi:hypothetical protein